MYEPEQVELFGQLNRLQYLLNNVSGLIREATVVNVLIAVLLGLILWRVW